MQGNGLDFFVTGFDTSGTLTGIGQMMKVARPEVKVVVAEPEDARILAANEWKVHAIQGWTPDFVPTLLDSTVIDSLVTIDDQSALDTARRLAKHEGILVGISAGATVATALKVAETAPERSAASIG